MSVLRGRVVLVDRVLDDAVLVLSGDRISEVRPPRAGDPAPAGTLLPGLVDIHCHGGGGHSFATNDPSQARAAALFHAQRGTTTVLASLASDHAEAMCAHARVLAGCVADGTLAGVHLEGPFLSPKRRGAHRAELLHLPEVALARDLLAAAGGQVRQVTLAPELTGVEAVADLVRASGAIVSVGHSDADAATAARAFAAGARAATHLFNAMRPWQHRESSVVAAALAGAGRGEVVVELIADGSHVDAGTVAAVFALVGDQVALVSDALPTAGASDGEYVHGSMTLVVAEGLARTPDGAIAGGSGTLLDVVRFAHEQAGVDLRTAVAAASQIPARLLGLDTSLGVGALRPDARADVLVIDDALRLRQVWHAGRLLD